MIYIVDEPLSETSHSRFIAYVIKEHTSSEIEFIEIGSTIKSIVDPILLLSQKVKPSDIVLCAWAIPGNSHIDGLFSDLAECCWVVTAAGNSGESIKDTTPARVANVITVGCLNKSGKIASLSNFSETKNLEWVTGTNYSVGWKTSSGTSVSAALYAAFLAEALAHKDFSVIKKLIEQHAAQGRLV